MIMNTVLLCGCCWRRSALGHLRSVVTLEEESTRLPLRWTCGGIVQAYRRCEHALRGVSGAKALFLRCYALYIAGERHREQKSNEDTTSTSATSTTNQVCMYDPLTACSLACPCCPVRCLSDPAAAGHMLVGVNWLGVC